MNPYDVLSVSQEATDAEVQRRYRKLAMEYHPDRNPGDAVAVEKFKHLQAAYETLSDPAKRARIPLRRPKAPQAKRKQGQTSKYTAPVSIADAPPPRYDLWGQPIVAVRREEWKDVFANHYEADLAPEIR